MLGICKTRCSIISEILISTALHVAHLQACRLAAPAGTHQQVTVSEPWLLEEALAGFP